MNPTSAFSSHLAPLLSDYLALKMALGRRYDQERRILQSLDRFLTEVGVDLSYDTFGRWCATFEQLSSTTRRNRMRMVRNFCLYRQRTQPDCFIPDMLLFPDEHQPVRPYIFRPDEIARLLELTSTLKPASTSPLYPEVSRLAIVLLFTAGLRRGELTRLQLSDYDHREHTLLIRASKFHKSRTLPLSSSAQQELETFLDRRRVAWAPLSAEAPLLWSPHGRGRPYTGTGIGGNLRRLFWKANILKPDGLPPRVHDLRHSFAVNALLRWYRAGVDVQTRLPFLAAYMGHISIVSTEYYLHFIEELAGAASSLFEQRCGRLVTAAPRPGRTP